MPECNKCNKRHESKSRSECKACFDKTNSSATSMNNSNFISTNSSTRSSQQYQQFPLNDSRSPMYTCFTSTNPLNGPPSSQNNSMNDYLINYVSTGNTPQNQFTNTSMLQTNANTVMGTTATTTHLQPNLPLDAGKPLTELCVGDIFTIMSNIVAPISAQLSTMNTTMTTKMAETENRVALLENQARINESKIETLSQIVVNMQSSLNKLDGDVRENNIMVAGLTETDVDLGNGTKLTSDSDKMRHILYLIDATEAKVDEYTTERIGKQRSDRPRVVKINTGSKEQRNMLLAKTRLLKQKTAPWKSVYMNKDVHPVYRNETARVRKKMKALKEENPENQEIKIQEGALMIGEKVVDRNTFFRSAADS